MLGICRTRASLVWSLAATGCSLDQAAIGASPDGAALDSDDLLGAPGSFDDRSADASPARDADTESGAGSSGQVGPGQSPAQAADAAVLSPGPVGPGNGDAGTGSAPDAAGISASKCQEWLEMVVRDFTPAHPDFEKFNIAAQGLVRNRLGADQKPVYANPGATVATAGPDEFYQWYNDVPGVNQRLATRLAFVEQKPGTFVYDSTAFFPIDDMGFGNGPRGGFDVPGLGAVAANAPDHNFLFTTEVHFRFTYRGGELLSFRGDDDMWVFLDGMLVIDLGGPHLALDATVSLDALAERLGLTVGETYAMDIFHAERHTDQSNYRLETTIDMSCIENVHVD